MRITWANSLRGIAAVIVVVAHLGVLFWMNQSAIAPLARHAPLWEGSAGAPPFARALNWLPIEFGALGVALFFLVSGYVIALSVNKYNRRGFVVGRLMRVLPTYAAGFLVTCLVIFFVGDPNHELSAPSILVGMIPGLPYLVPVPTPADGIVWTLIVELAFYSVCLMTYRWITSRWITIVLIVAACALVHFLLPNPSSSGPFAGLVTLVLICAPFLPVMLIGVVLSSSTSGSFSPVAVAILVPVLAVAYFVLDSTSRVAPSGLKYHLTFLGAIIVFVVVWRFAGQRGANRVLDFFASISYPLYVVHSVLGYALLAVLAAAGIWPVAAIATATIIAILVAWALHVVVERPTQRLGQRWARLLGTRSKGEKPARSGGNRPRITE